MDIQTTDLEKYIRLLDEILRIKKKHEKKFFKTGGQFNIFSILRVERDEVKTHSRFLVELLNPKGNHGQGDLFLKRFLQQLDTKNFETSKASVSTEYYIGKVNNNKTKGGQIDVFIRDNHGSIIMIENKIDADEEENQLLRYYNAFPEGKLFFLTLYGSKSKNHNNFDKYRHISYKEDIVNWLEKCTKEINSIPSLKESICQYIRLIKSLTNQNESQKMKRQIHEAIYKNIEGASSIANEFDNAINSISNQFKEDIQRKIQKKNPSLKIRLQPPRKKNRLFFRHVDK